MAFSVADLDDAVSDAVEEVAVVGDENHRAVELLKLSFEDLQGVDIEVVGRLVEDEAVRFSQHDQEQLQPGPLSPTKGRHGFPDLLVAEEETSEQLDGIAFVHRPGVAHEAERRGARLRFVVLRQIPYIYGWARPAL